MDKKEIQDIINQSENDYNTAMLAAKAIMKKIIEQKQQIIVYDELKNRLKNSMTGKKKGNFKEKLVQAA